MVSNHFRWWLTIFAIAFKSLEADAQNLGIWPTYSLNCYFSNHLAIHKTKTHCKHFKRKWWHFSCFYVLLALLFWIIIFKGETCKCRDSLEQKCIFCHTIVFMWSENICLPFHLVFFLKNAENLERKHCILHYFVTLEPPCILIQII